MTMITIDDSGSYEVTGHTGAILTELVRDEFGKLNCQIAELTALKSLTVERDGIERVVVGQKIVKIVLAAIEKKRVVLKRPSLEQCRMIDDIAKQLKDAVGDIAGHLGAQREQYEEAQRAEERRIEAERRAVTDARIAECAEWGIAVTVEQAEQPFETWTWWFSDRKKEAQEKREQEERDRKELEELRKLKPAVVQEDEVVSEPASVFATHLHQARLAMVEAVISAGNEGRLQDLFEFCGYWRNVVLREMES